MKVDTKLPVVCSAGKVIIYTDNGEDPLYPIVGEIRLSDSKWLATKWSACGKSVSGTEFDIINPLLEIEVLTAMLLSPSNSIYTIGSFESKDALYEYLLTSEEHRSSKVMGVSVSKLQEGTFTYLESDAS